MTYPLLTVSTTFILIAVGCGVTGAVMAARKRIRTALILNAILVLLMGVSTEVRVWSNRLEEQQNLRFGREGRAAALGSIAIARDASSPEVREEALKTAEEAVKLSFGEAAPANGDALLNEMVALGLFVLGSVTLTLALTRPDILSTRIKRDNQTAQNSAPVAASGVDL